MAKEQNVSNSSAAPMPTRFSLDAWAVALALALAGLIWIGVIKHIPW